MKKKNKKSIARRSNALKHVRKQKKKSARSQIKPVEPVKSTGGQVSRTPEQNSRMLG